MHCIETCDWPPPHRPAPLGSSFCKCRFPQADLHEATLKDRAFVTRTANPDCCSVAFSGLCSAGVTQCDTSFATFGRCDLKRQSPNSSRS